MKYITTVNNNITRDLSLISPVELYNHMVFLEFLHDLLLLIQIIFSAFVALLLVIC